MSEYIKWFNELSIKDVDLVGGKNAYPAGVARCLLEKSRQGDSKENTNHLPSLW